MHCQICGAYFDKPLLHSGADPTVFPSYRYREELCPVCGQPHIESAKVCPICRAYMPDDGSGNVICRHCRTSLLRRLNAFADDLQEEEEDQLDEWLDGRSIKERSEFR